MIVGIVLTVLLGVIALWQTLRLAGHRSSLAVIEQQREVPRQLADRLEERNQLLIGIATAMGRAHEAIMRRDGPALHEAIREANRVMAGRPSKEPA